MAQETEREKMLRGAWYDANFDKALIEERRKAELQTMAAQSWEYRVTGCRQHDFYLLAGTCANQLKDLAIRYYRQCRYSFIVTNFFSKQPRRQMNVAIFIDIAFNDFSQEGSYVYVILR